MRETKKEKRKGGSEEEKKATFLYCDVMHRSARRLFACACVYRIKRDRVIQGSSERRRIGAPFLRKRHLKPDVDADALVCRFNRYTCNVLVASKCTLLLATILRGVAAENLSRFAADAMRYEIIFLSQSAFYMVTHDIAQVNLHNMRVIDQDAVKKNGSFEITVSKHTCE